MCLEPLKVIEGMKKKRDYSKPLAYLGLASILFGLSAGLGFNTMLSGAVGGVGVPDMSTMSPIAVGISIAVLTFFAGIFVSWIFSLGMEVLGSKGKLYEGLVCISYPLKLLSVGVVISALASLLGPVSWLISFVALCFFGVLAYATIFRATKDVFKVDTLTAFIGITVLFGVLMLAFYGSAMFGVMTSLSSLVPTA